MPKREGRAELPWMKRQVIEQILSVWLEFPDQSLGGLLENVRPVGEEFDEIDDFALVELLHEYQKKSVERRATWEGFKRRLDSTEAIEVIVREIRDAIRQKHLYPGVLSLPIVTATLAHPRLVQWADEVGFDELGTLRDEHARSEEQKKTSPR